MQHIDKTLLGTLKKQGHEAAAAAPELEKSPIRAVQVGEGNFLRAFIDWMLNQLAAAGRFEGRVVVVQPRRRRKIDTLNEQDGLYTVVTRGLEKGERVDRAEIVSVIAGALNPFDEWGDFLRLAANPDLRFFISNTTEAGLDFEETERPTSECPENFPAKVAAFLYARWRALGGGADTGLIFLPTELLENNGARLREYVAEHAENWELPEDFIEWAKYDNHYLNTLVDRIVPGRPDEEEAARLEQGLGYRDEWLTVAEPYHFLAVEGPADLEAELPLREAGLNVVWTDDIAPYRERKLRLLNGAHTASVLLAHLAGAETVRGMMEDRQLAEVTRFFLLDEILPTVPGDAEDNRAFAEAVLERFANPFLEHRLLDIAVNSVAKWRVRVKPSLEAQFAASGQPGMLGLSLAALLLFYRVARTERGRYYGEVDGQVYEIRDSEEAIERIDAFWRRWPSETERAGLIQGLITDRRLWAIDDKLASGLAVLINALLDNLCSMDVRNALQFLGFRKPA